MNITMSQCETCKKRVDDRYIHTGWIVTKGNMSISKGRKAGTTGDALTGYGREEERDFCSVKCYVAWLGKL